MFQKLGFVIHPDKSIFIPAKTVEYLGFIIDNLSIGSEKNKNNDEEKVISMQR